MSQRTSTERSIPPPDAEESTARRVDVEVARLAERDWGVLSIDELRDCGLNKTAVSVRVRTGRLHRLHQAVYAVGRRGVTLQGRFLAAVKACGPAAVLSHVAAAVLHGLIEWDHRAVDVTLVGEHSRLHAGIRCHRTSHLGDVDRRTVQGIPVTAPARTLLDCAGCLDEQALRRAVREALSRKLVTLEELVDVLARLGPRRGSRKLARIVAHGYVPTRSVLEDVVFDLIERGGFERPDVNVPLVRGGRRVVPDFRWPEQRLTLEADGAAWHDHKLAREDDADRQALLEEHGDRVIRVTWEQAVDRPAQTLARFRAAGAPERRAVDSSA